MKDIIIFDLDGTLADVRHRVHHVSSPTKGERNWEAFYRDMVLDLPNDSICEMARIFKRAGMVIWILTGRSEDHRAFTEHWMFWNGVRWNELRMRPINDMRKDTECKSDMLSEEEQKRVLVIFEDRQQVVDMWRDRGITVCQVDNGEF